MNNANAVAILAWVLALIIGGSALHGHDRKNEEIHREILGLIQDAIKNRKQADTLVKAEAGNATLEEMLEHLERDH